MSRPASISWLARHEIRLAWRDWQSLMTAGNRRRLSRALVVLAVIILALHLPAFAIVGDFAHDGMNPDTGQLVTVSIVVALYFSLLLSQAMESVTRTLYSRGDLDLVLSSPVSPRRLFAVRIAANAVLIAIVGLFLASPFIDVLTLSGGPRWLGGFGVALSLAVIAAALSVAITVGMFRLLGPRRTRVAAQIVAAVIGAAFAIGIQVAAIVNYGQLARTGLGVPPGLVTRLPGETSLVWLLARALLGDWRARGRRHDRCGRCALRRDYRLRTTPRRAFARRQ